MVPCPDSDLVGVCAGIPITPIERSVTAWLRTPNEIVEGQMQVEANARASAGLEFKVRQAVKSLIEHSALQEPMIVGVISKLTRSTSLLLCVFVACLSAFVTDLAAQTGNVVISTDTTWATGTYNLTTLSVENGATLTIGGGSTVNVSSAMLVTAASDVVLQSINNAVQVNGAWMGAGVTLNAGSIQVDAGSSINADGQGYLANAGPGGAPGGSSDGGSYGGLGGTGYGSPTASPVYGSNTTPADLGSGGGSRCCGVVAGPGGGAVRLIVSGTLTDNGIISANGTNVVGDQGGGGSGGSVWVTTAALAGSGVFTANGGTGGEAAGAGGRVAVYYYAPTGSFTGFSTSTSTGGSCGTQCANGAASAGQNGTAAFFDTSATNANLMVDQDLTIPAGTTVTYNSITVQSNAILTIGGGSVVKVTGALTVSGTVVAQSINNAAQVAGSWQGSGVTLHAASVVVSTGGSINADSQGYVANAGPGGSPAGSSDGGSYGGVAGIGYGSSAAPPTYGSTTAPTDLGSGGGSRCCGTIPGAGGGALTITVSGSLTDNGRISANGGDGTGAQVGGGSGGTVSIQTGTLAGSGSVAANGGAGGEGGGGGGRVALYYNTNNGFNTTLVTSNGGASSGGNAGAAGTVYTLGAGSNLTVSDNTALPPNANLSFSNITINNGATLTVGSGTTLASNTVTVTGAANFKVGGGSTLNVSGAFLVTANSNVVLQSINNALQVNGAWEGAGVTLNAGSVQVDAGSSINADGQGYLANAGPGGAPGGSSDGGSYGGPGGAGYGSPAPPAIYGSNTTPTDLGSGGGSRCCGAIPGPGGGAMRLIVSGTLTDNGIISANGTNEVGDQAGGGSGGSVWVTTAGLAGSGVFTANGGTGGEASGGGGRIAVYYNAPTSSFTGFSASSSNGGSCGTQCANGTASAGGTGTAAFFDTSSPNDNLMVNQDLTIPAGTTASYNSITVQPNAVLTIGGGSTVTVAGSVTVSGTVLAQSINNAVQVNGTWQGSGVTLNATSVLVNPGGSINADNQGYVSNAGPGGAPAGSSDGGSYAGLGGVGYGSATAPPVYGSTTAPTDLGSGGGSRCCGTTPGAGGGALTMKVTETLTDNGVISANGGNGIGSQVGGGSGGTVAIQTGTLTGTGTITSTGGLGGEAGGGGGRIALYYNTNSGFNIAQATAAGGASGASPGAPGTVYALGAGTNLTVSFNTVLPANANLTYTNVLVNNQGTLTLGSGTTMGASMVSVTAAGTFTVGGGSTVTVSNAVSVTAKSNVVLQSINNAAQVNGTWQGKGVTLKAGSVQVDAGSSINADGQGYLPNAGPGGAAGGTSNGGSYGGMGGEGYGSPLAAAVYGSDTTPTDLGSGGGSRCCAAVPGPGGGAVRLIVSGTLTDNGVISANGINVMGTQAGAGSGGSVWVTTAGLAGSGSFAANGGTGGEAAGGGGRIAVYYKAPASTFTGFSASSANGGTCGTTCANGSLSAGSVGTAGFFDTSATNDNLMVDQDLTIPAGTTVAYNSITVQPGALLTIGGGSIVTVAGSLTVSGTVVAQSINNSALVNNTWQGSGVVINATSLLVNPGGSLNADSQGYLPNSGPGGAPVGSSSGGSYGGLGGAGYGSAAPTLLYGSTTAPIDLGSGGGSRCCAAVPGAGGGALTINVSGTLTDNGMISANGGSVVGSQAGGGAGGSLSITTAALAGSGAFTANGGVGGEAGGGGGRVTIYYDAPSSTFTGFAAATGTGGACGVSAGSSCGSAASGGGNGTTAFFDTSATFNNVTIYQNFTIPAGTSPAYNSVTVQNGGLLTIGGGATVTVTKALTVSGTVVAQSANNTTQVNGVWAGTGVAINAGSIAITGTGSLNADSQGYVAGAGPGGAPAGSSTGGSYGGLGGVGYGSSFAPPTYGSKTLPVDLGSGGNSRCCGTIPGAGGGDLLLTVTGTLLDDGVISANGQDGIGSQVGGGSGGSLSIHTPALTGSGTIAANGGLGGEGGGGGGRVALYFNSASGFDLTKATALGGSSSGNVGAVGTVYIPGLLGSTAASTTSLTAMPAQLSLGQAVTLKAVVTSATAGLMPTGTVNFVDGTTVIGTQSLTSSQQSGVANAQFQTSVLGGGMHSLTAIYTGDSTVAASESAAQTITISPAATTSTLGLSAATIAVGQTEMLTVTIAGGIANPAIAGTVNFFDTTTNSSLGILSVTPGTAGGTAVLAVSNLTVGTHIINALYSGTLNYQASTAPSQTVVVTAKTQTIMFPAIPGHTFGDAPFTLLANASSGLPVSYAVTGGPGTVLGNVVTITGVGTVSIQATQTGTGSGYAAAAPVTQSFAVARELQTIIFPAVPSHTAGDAPFQLGATASSGLEVAYTVIAGPATVIGNVVTLSGVGTVQIQATQTGNTDFAAATSVNRSFIVSLGTQTITFPQISNHMLGDAPFSLNAVASSGLPVNYVVTAGPAKVSGNVVTLTGTGTVSIQASQTGNATTYAAAIPVTQSFTVAKATQTITFAPIQNRTLGDAPFPLNATASSGLPVSYAVISGPATVSGNVVTITGVGTVSIQAIQAGNATSYDPAAPVTQSFIVATKMQTITFAPIPNHTVGDAPFPLNATASSGLPVSYAVTSGPATVSGNVVTITAAGMVSIQATQAGNATTYAAASPITQTFTVSKGTQTITFAPIPNHAAADAPFLLSATASSGLAILYSVTDGPATIAGNVVTLTGSGTVQIQATQPGNTNYAAANPVSRIFTVSPQPQTITFPAIPNHTLGEEPFPLSAIASSGLTVVYSVVSGPATVLGDTVTLTGAGAVVIKAAQAGNAIYAAALPVTRSFTISSSPPTLASIAPAGGVVGSGATLITLTGAHFASTDIIELNGAAIVTNLVSSLELTAVVPASFLNMPGVGQITVFDSETKFTTTAQSFTVSPAPAITFSGPSTTPPASQPSLTFKLVNPYPFAIAGSLSLAFTPSASNGVDDPAVQFSTGGRTLFYNIPALSQVTPAVQIQSGTVAGVATVTLMVSSNGVNVTPANVIPIEIIIPPAVPMVTTASVTRSGTTLTVSMNGFSNTRELVTAMFHFTAVPGSTLTSPDITVQAATLFTGYFTSTASAAYGSSFVYEQNFALNEDASSIQNVTITLVNTVGDSIQVTTQ